MRKIDHEAFTLIELLVVVAIIAVLVAILLPALKSARERAKEAACCGRQKQVHMAILLYAEDYNGYAPPPWEDSLKLIWTRLLALHGYLPYRYGPPGPWPDIAGTDLAFCPVGGWYAENNYAQANVNPETGTAESATRLSLFRLPAVKILIGDGSFCAFGGYATWIWSFKASDYSACPRHRAGGRFTFVDGHVGWVGVNDRPHYDPLTWCPWCE